MQAEPALPPQGHEPTSGFGELLHGGRVHPKDVDELRDKLFFDREDSADPYVRFAVLLVLSVVIATGGVLSDSTATVIGAMIVAPLMTPIMAAALAVVTGDGRRVVRSLVIVAVGAGVAIGLSFAIAAGTSQVVVAATNSQVVGRVSPRVLDLFVALASGAAGAFALSRRNVSDALPGVAIAISLVPPLAVVGVMAANGDLGAAAGALLLFTTNLLAILIAGGTLLTIMGYGSAALGPTSSPHRRRAAIVITVSTAAILFPLAITSVRLAKDSLLEYSAGAIADDVVAGSDAEVARVVATTDRIEVAIAGEPADRPLAEETARLVHEEHPDIPVRVYLLESLVIEVPAER